MTNDFLPTSSLIRAVRALRTEAERYRVHASESTTDRGRDILLDDARRSDAAAIDLDVFLNRRSAHGVSGGAVTYVCAACALEEAMDSLA